MATIERTHLKGNGDQSYYLKMRYTSADAKTTLQKYVREHSALQKSPMTRKMIVGLFCKETLGFLPRRNAEPLAVWLFEQSLKHGYIVEMMKVWVDDVQEYLISPTLMSKRPGPKTK